MQNSIGARKDGRQWKFLFVNAKESDTEFLTKNPAVEVIHAAQWENAESEMKRQSVSGVFLDIASATPENLLKLKQKHDTAVMMLADVADLPRAIEHVKQGDAHGFVVKGVSDSESVLKLVQFAARRTVPA